MSLFHQNQPKPRPIISTRPAGPGSAAVAPLASTLRKKCEESRFHEELNYNAQAHQEHGRAHKDHHTALDVVI